MITPALLKALYDRAAEVAGRPVEVEKTTDGQYVVLWLNFASAPAPKKPTEEEALAAFIDMVVKLPKEDTLDEQQSGTGSIPKSPEDDQSV
jgi:hypothetical protein